MEPNWKPLIAKLGDKRCVGFMFMGRVNGINLYKHGMVRMYLNLDDRGRCYRFIDRWHFEETDFAAELARIEAALSKLDETLESVYDENYIARKRKALRSAGIVEETIQVDPDNWTVN